MGVLGVPVWAQQEEGSFGTDLWQSPGCRGGGQWDSEWKALGSEQEVLAGSRLLGVVKREGSGVSLGAGGKGGEQELT